MRSHQSKRPGCRPCDVWALLEDVRATPLAIIRWIRARLGALQGREHLDALGLVRPRGGTVQARVLAH